MLLNRIDKVVGTTATDPLTLARPLSLVSVGESHPNSVGWRLQILLPSYSLSPTMPDSILDLKAEDHLLGEGPDSDSPEMIGKVVRIHESRLGREVKEKLGIPIKGEP